MKIFRVLLPVIIAGVVLLAPHAAFAANATFFGPVIPTECHCDNTAPDFGCVLAVIQNLINLFISLGVIIFVLAASYAGFTMMMNPVNPQAKEQGKTMLTNAVVGLLIALSAWLIVDFVMDVFYNKSFGMWNSILTAGATGDTHCLVETQPPVAPDPINGGNGGVTGDGGNGGSHPAGDTSHASPTHDGHFESDVPGQASAASGKLNTLITCMANYVPGDVGRISSISDGNGGVACYADHPTWPQCPASGGSNCCFHAHNSCHYGGHTSSTDAECGHKSFAVDFGDGDPGTANSQWLTSAANSCHASFVNHEGNHLHVSVGSACGCN